MPNAPALADVLKELGDPVDRPPPHPVQHGSAGILLSLAVPGSRGPVWRGIWVRPDGIDFLGEAAASTGLSRSFHLSGASAGLIDLIADTTRRYLESVESIDERLADFQSRGGSVPAAEVWALHRELSAVRSMIGRTTVVVAEASGPSLARFPGAEKALEAVEREVDRVHDLAAQVQQSLSDLILLRNAEESNRIAAAANQLSKTSNRIAELANISNIRMLGITYVALVLGLVSAVVLIPNTGATILGMPSAAWVPGLWVDLILIVLAVIPLVLVFTRPWVTRILRDLASSETRLAEGIQDLPELHGDGATRPAVERKPL